MTICKLSKFSIDRVFYIYYYYGMNGLKLNSWHGVAWPAVARLGKAGSPFIRGPAGQDSARLGKACLGVAWRDEARDSHNRGMAWLGSAGPGVALRDMFRRGPAGRGKETTNQKGAAM